MRTLLILFLAMATAQDHWQALTAIGALAALAVTLQFVLDYRSSK
jgi:hypothetical protein